MGDTVNEKHKNDFIKRAQLFASLTDSEMNLIISKMAVKQFKKNETILHEEDTNEYMYIILMGKVKVLRRTEDGKEIILAIHKSGSFFGEMSLIDGKTTPASVMATEDSLIAIISKNDFFTIIFHQNKVTKNLLKILCSRLRTCWNTIELLNFNNASQRAKMLFLMLSDEYGIKTPEGVTLNIKLTHQDISDMTGLTRETVTRVIDKMQKNKEITILKDKLIQLTPKFMQQDVKILI
jgi:CRP/FNR family transcriptional regulator